MVEYADSNGWGDLLTSYDGETITYDTIGNPLTYRDGMTMTWVNGRELSSLSKDGKTYNFTYDPSGLRTKKSITTSSGSTTNVEYIYEGGLLMQMTYGNYVLDFSYDANGTPVAFHVDNGDTVDKYIYYGVNSRGDVEALYNADGTLHARYEYDAYGKILSVKASDGTNITATYAIAVLNPLRYRSYVYDNETGFYYLQSRYYDPITCRFICADSVIPISNGLVNGNNMFVYCFNNPINMTDSSGGWPKWIEDAGNWINNNIIQPVKSFFSPDTMSASGQFQEGVLKGSGSATFGYSESNTRLQLNSKSSSNNGMIGIYEKDSVGNASGKIGVGNDDFTVSLKGVGDGLTGTLQAGVQYSDGLGVAGKAKASVVSGRITLEFEICGWQIELGASGDFLSVGAEAMIGVFPDEGFTAKASYGAGVWGVGYVFRAKPPQ